MTELAQFSSEVNDEIKDLTRDLFREDELGAVLRVHLRVEKWLTQTIKCLLPRPDHLPRLSYESQVKLALALGLKEQYGPPLKALGTLRNTFAHRLDTNLTRRQINDLYATFQQEDKAEIQATFLRMKQSAPDEMHESCFADLEPGDQFKIIAITLWGVVRSAVLLHSRNRSIED